MVQTDSLFEEDDDETQRYLLDRSHDESTLVPRLESLSERFVQDHQDPTLDNQWTHLVETVNAAGFAVNVSSKKPAPPGPSSVSPPSAFDTEEGKKHLQALTSVLGLASEQRAVQVTMNAVRELKDSKNLQSLLGTRSLVQTVMKYHHRQRLARISTIAELLRQEQDGSGAMQDDSIGKLLDTLDSACVLDGQNRGLFKTLLSIACRRVDGQVLTRDQLSSCKSLQESAPPSFSETLNRPSAEKTWYQFAAQCLNDTRSCFHTERIRAMEALVALLYTRTKVRRAEYFLILKAFQSSDAFFTASVEDQQLAKYAGLICAECMGLWRVFDKDSYDFSWIQDHPLLEGILEKTNTSQPDREFATLKVFFQSCPNENQMILCQKQIEVGDRKSVV